MSNETTALTLTPAQIVEIYEAGIKRGNEESTAYEWGSRPSGAKLQELEDAIVWNGDRFLPSLDFDAKVAWWEAFKKELSHER